MMVWLHVGRGEAPLIVSIPHAGTRIPESLVGDYVSLERARYDTDWYIDKLYAFASRLGATVVRTAISRSVIDVNRDPSGASLYPGQTTTELCPTTTFNGELLYKPGAAPNIEARKRTWFAPYHTALSAEIERLRSLHPAIVLYEAHSIRSVVPRLFDGELPQFNIGTNSGAACSPALAALVEARCTGSRVIDGRFKGGWTTRHYGNPAEGVHAIQMELACRGYCFEGGAWPPRWDRIRATPMQSVLIDILKTCIDFAKGQA